MAQFRFDQATPGAGVAGRSRHDLIAGEEIDLVATDPAPGAGVTYSWEITDKVNSTAVLSATTGSSVKIGAGGTPIVPLCGFKVKLTADDNGVVTTTERICSVRSDVTGLRPPLFAEGAPPSGTLASNDPDLSMDNALYTDRAGLGASGQNWRGWGEWAWEVTNYLEGGSGFGGELVFEWNGVDTTQFEGSDAFADGAGTVSLSVVAVPEWGNALRVTGTGTAMCAVRLANDPIPFRGTRRDLLIEVVQQNIVQGVGGYAGFAFCADDVGGYHGLNHLVTGLAEWSSRIDNDVRSTPVGTGQDIGNTTAYGRAFIRGVKPAGAPPQVASYLEGYASFGAVDADGRRTGSNRNGMNPFGSGTALPASWNSLACDRWGLCLQSSGGNPAPTNWDILMLRVYMI